MRKPLLVVLSVLAVAAAGTGLGVAQGGGGPSVRTSEELLTVPGGITSRGTVSIDTTLYVP